MPLKVLVVRRDIAKWLKKQKNLLPDCIETIVPEKGTAEEILTLARDVEVIVCSRLSAETVMGGQNAKLGDGHEIMRFFSNFAMG